MLVRLHSNETTRRPLLGPSIHSCLGTGTRYVAWVGGGRGRGARLLLVRLLVNAFCFCGFAFGGKTKLVRRFTRSTPSLPEKSVDTTLITLTLMCVFSSSHLIIHFQFSFYHETNKVLIYRSTVVLAICVFLSSHSAVRVLFESARK
jgi:hypothetical protein